MGPEDKEDDEDDEKDEQNEENIFKKGIGNRSRFQGDEKKNGKEKR